MVLLLLSRRSTCFHGRFPLGPPGWPILGNLLDLGKMPHRALTELRELLGSSPLWLVLASVAPRGHGRHVSKCINETTLIRQKCIDKMLLWIEEESRKIRQGQGVHVTRFLAAAGHSNLADFFPWLRWLDPQGVMKKMEKGISARLLKSLLGNGKDEPAKFSERDMIFFILELFIAGLETTSSTIEWALVELVCKPDSTKKAKTELTQAVGQNRKVEERDIQYLPYLQAVIKETLRLHPPLPFLIPRKAMRDTNFMGYFIPNNTQVLVNAWAIGRDQDVWVEPSCFKPERFIDSNKVDYKGQHYELIPFGAGRRIATPEAMDMKDRLGITMRKLEPLLAVPSKSDIIA
ncbi:hypothetical protein FEM48_Zijuj12G0053000 [Ziziphus jujuba var. spinosa]|uniref:Cytochrome P450 76A2-like n=1 Tax=Ziziphus jujuba var. spinosa TaxID=714518 RepID=A0A978UBE1_ZIZJJ|nr:hypothetical protein FEM48_Zijuj12G0053000 [Ziziphus jujuba var. spinosa]